MTSCTSDHIRLSDYVKIPFPGPSIPSHYPNQTVPQRFVLSPYSPRSMHSHSTFIDLSPGTLSSLGCDCFVSKALFLTLRLVPVLSLFLFRIVWWAMTHSPLTCHHIAELVCRACSSDVHVSLLHTSEGFTVSNKGKWLCNWRLSFWILSGSICIHTARSVLEPTSASQPGCD